MFSAKATLNNGGVECQSGLDPCSSSVCYLPMQNGKNSNSTLRLLGVQGGVQTNGFSPDLLPDVSPPADGSPIALLPDTPTQPTTASTVLAG